jgi:hypothetical protein
VYDYVFDMQTVILIRTSVISKRISVIYTRRVRFLHTWVWFLHADYDLVMQAMILTRTNMNSTRMSEFCPETWNFHKKSVISTRKVWFSLTECDYDTHKCDNDLHECDLTSTVGFPHVDCYFDTHKCNFYTHECDFDTQSKIFTRMRWYLHADYAWDMQTVNLTPTSVISTRMSVILTRKMQFLHEKYDLYTKKAISTLRM